MISVCMEMQCVALPLAWVFQIFRAFYFPSRKDKAYSLQCPLSICIKVLTSSLLIVTATFFLGSLSLYSNRTDLLFIKIFKLDILFSGKFFLNLVHFPPHSVIYYFSDTHSIWIWLKLSLNYLCTVIMEIREMPLKIHYTLTALTSTHAMATPVNSCALLEQCTMTNVLSVDGSIQCTNNGYSRMSISSLSAENNSYPFEKFCLCLPFSFTLVWLAPESSLLGWVEDPAVVQVLLSS